MCAATAGDGWRMARGQLADSNGCGGLLQGVREGCAVPCLDVERLLHPHG